MFRMNESFDLNIAKYETSEGMNI